MRFTTRKINTYLFFKLPIAWLAGVRLFRLTEKESCAHVRLRWLNQNPFNSIYFAVQAMAAELTTGVLVMREIKKHHLPISMLVTQNSSVFHKKAKGKIIFSCQDAEQIHEIVNEAVASKQGQNLWLKSQGVDHSGDCVSEFKFLWSIKLKQ